MPCSSQKSSYQMRPIYPCPSSSFSQRFCSERIQSYEIPSSLTLGVLIHSEEAVEFSITCAFFIFRIGNKVVSKQQQTKIEEKVISIKRMSNHDQFEKVFLQDIFLQANYNNNLHSPMRNHSNQEVLVDIFALAHNRIFRKQEKDSIEKQIMKSITKNDGIFCNICGKDLNKIIFIYEEYRYFCPNCLSQEKDVRNHLCVFVELPIKRKHHEQIAEDIPLLGKQIETYKEQSGKKEAFSSLEEVLLFENLRNTFWTANTDIFDIIAGEMHEYSNEAEKDFILNKISCLSKEKQQNEKTLKEIARKYYNGHVQADMSESESINTPFQEMTLRSRELLNKIERLIEENDRQFLLK